MEISASGMTAFKERYALSSMAASPLFIEQNVPLKRILGMRLNLIILYPFFQSCS